MIRCSLLLFFISLVNTLSAAEFEKLTVFPDNILLDNKRDYQNVTAQAFYNDGTTKNVLSEVKVEIKDKALCKIENGKFLPLKDGKTQAVLSYKGQSETIEIEVKNVAIDKVISFNLDVMPIFTKAGCNSGGCHGASRGKDRFRLALYGFDPDGDYDRLLNEFPGRRINLAVPEDSMLLTKAVNSVPHTGGKLFDENSFEYKTVFEWLSNGAPADKKDVKEAISLEFFPKETVIQGSGSQNISVRVTYSDGTNRDVTNLTTYISSDSGVGFINDKGLLENKNPGEAYIMARFGTLTALTRIISLPEKSPIVADLKGNNYIDNLVNQKLTKLRIQPSGLCSDEVFIRRAYLDIVGKLPDEESYHKFINDKSAGKRDKLVDELLQMPEFVDVWVMKWSELLQIRSNNNFSYKSTLLYYNWLKKKLTENVPIDQIALDLLSSSGSTFKTPATSFYTIERDKLKLTENIAQIFMGTRIQCAQCHNHPFDRWTMNDYYSFSAFFSQFRTKNDEDRRAQIVYDSRRGDIKHPITKKNMEPVFLGGGEADVKGKDRRRVFAEWLVSKENPYFASSLANRVWDQFFGRGITHPVDDARLSNPASNQELQDELAKRLTDYNYDFRKLIRDICTSRTYQLESKPNESNKMDEKNFSHASMRRIRAEILLDSITQVTETKDKFKSLPLGSRAVEIADGKTSSFFLTTFGRATRETVCSCEVKMEPNLSQALHLMNGDTVMNKIKSGKFVDTLLKEKKSPDEIIRRLYVRCYSREVKDEELAKLVPIVNDSKDKRETLEDIFWALLNSKEFIFVR
ncbi:MAG: DUF1549 and DUF1553 domain-containing protein [Lentisphaeraceae bacterium]|nr:DUF1549 and DUF1553 domain-containing protein [Lentisphaeraceae bacterium]